MNTYMVQNYINDLENYINHVNILTSSSEKFTRPQIPRHRPDKSRYNIYIIYILYRYATYCIKILDSKFFFNNEIFYYYIS